ncbi:LysR family transcriptional regulator [Cystobacter ferrugineus]|uniref:LysR family transcriptional regulator n=1 Tax=Cystobacter ferrugineus TaxID=83449 RepID=A0A1L9AZ39_9BACT|nr:LysR family transcriptional regulator [Cystobacter ferrugineus]OJH35275.1 LysR family transcriptional regulator [Cystobacter ferrugineus]
MSSLENIEAFVGAVEHGGFTRAARSLGLTPSAVSRRIARLEEELGVALFQRTTRALRLTDDGRAFHGRCRRILGELEEARRSMSRARTRPMGLLRVDAPQVLGQQLLVPALPTFFKRYPDIQLELTLRDYLVDPVVEGLDVMLRIGTPRDSALLSRRLGTTRMVACAAPGYLRRRGTPRDPEELARHDCLGFLRESRPVSWRLRTGTYEVKGPLSVNQGAALRDAAVAGLGICWVFDFMVSAELASGALVEVLEAYACDERPIHALYLENRHLLPKVRVFLDFAAALLRKGP